MLIEITLCGRRELGNVFGRPLELIATTVAINREIIELYIHRSINRLKKQWNDMQSIFLYLFFLCSRLYNDFTIPRDVTGIKSNLLVSM